MLSVYFDKENSKDFKQINEMQNMAQELCNRVKERGDLINMLLDFNFSQDAFESLKLLKELQEHEMAKTRVLPKKVGDKVTNLELLGVIEDEELMESCEESILWWNKQPNVISRGVAWSRKNMFTRSDYSFCFGKESMLKSDMTATISEVQSDCLSEELCVELNMELNELIVAPLFGIGGSRSDQYSDDDVIKEYQIQEETRLRVEQEEIWCLQEQKMMEEVFVNRAEGGNLSRPNKATDRVHLTYAFDVYLGQRGLLRCRFPWCKDVCVNRRFWESLVCLDPLNKGWIMDEAKLPEVMEQAKVFQKKGIDPTTYNITFRNAVDVPKQGGTALAYHEQMAKFFLNIVSNSNLSSLHFKIIMKSFNLNNPPLNLIFTLLIIKFLQSKVKTVKREVQLQALIDGKKVIISEAILRRDLHLEDAEGIECLPNAEIFEELVRMGAMESTVICLATGQKFNFSKYILDSMVKNMDSTVKFLMYPRFIQVLLDNQLDDMTSHKTKYTPCSFSKGFCKYEESWKRVLDLETDRTAQDLEIVKLKGRVKNLERRKKSRTPGLQRLRKVGSTQRVESSDDVSLGGNNENDDNLMFDVGALDGVTTVSTPVTTAGVTISAAEPIITTATDFSEVDMTLSKALAELKISKPKVPVMQEATPIISSSKDKGKAKMAEPERPMKRKDQIDNDAEVARIKQEQWQAQVDEEERLRKKREEEASMAAIVELYDEAIRNKPPTKSQLKNLMMTYLKHTGSKEDAMRDGSRNKREAWSSKKQMSPNKQTKNDQESVDSDKELREIKCGDVHVYKLIGINESFRHFSTFSGMLEVLDRLDVLDLHKVVMERFPANDPEGYDLILWGDLKTLVEPNEDDEI
uniref:Phospholipase-like protein n=1 Tax=Tanacetum cinerariifolium TaxID=118510 RepID=A0A6L2KJG4_TANCI|nr:phospholipase-like protein [Tanacetum cinerariifolium]